MVEAGRSVRDSRQFCSLCYFHFWRPTRVFYLGRFDDLIPDPSLISKNSRLKMPEPQDTVLLGDHYFVAFDPINQGLAWQLLQRLENHGEVVHPHPTMEPEATVSGWPVFPICWNCFWVTKEFLIHRNQHVPNKATIASLDALYAAIHAQWRLTDPGNARSDQRWALKWPHKSYRGPFIAYDRWERTAPTTLYPEEQTSEPIDKWRWLVDNPYRPLPSLPDFLLSHLRPASGLDDSDDINDTACDTSSQSFRNNMLSATDPRLSLPASPLERLPNELLTQIVSYLDHASVFALRLSSRHFALHIVLDQQFWYRHLIANRLFGFFFDFDSMKVMEETRSKCQKRGKLPPHWDWKRLVGELARFESFQNGGVMADAPGAFRNRRRIWKILEVAEQNYGFGAKAIPKAKPPPMEATRVIKA